MEYDELELDTLGEEKTALFVIISDTDATFNFVVSIMYSQLFNLLCDKADDVYNGRLPVHVRMLLDEFANIGRIPNIDKALENFNELIKDEKKLSLSYDKAKITENENNTQSVYDVTASDYHCKVIKKENTVLYVTAYPEYKEDAEKLVKELGY